MHYMNSPNCSDDIDKSPAKYKIWGKRYKEYGLYKHLSLGGAAESSLSVSSLISALNHIMGEERSQLYMSTNHSFYHMVVTAPKLFRLSI